MIYLMTSRFYGYQYDTNPRKLNGEYNPYVNRYSEGKARAVKNAEELSYKNTEKTSTSSRRNSSNAGARSSNRAKHTKKAQPRRNKRYEEEYAASPTREYEYNNFKDSDDSTRQSSKLSRASIKARAKLVLMLLAGFSVLFVISYQNSLVSESFNKKESCKKELEALTKTNQQIEVNIENNLNLNNIEQVAKNKIGMQKLDNNQKIYVSLPKEDFVAPATEQVVIEENVGFFEKLVKGFTKSVK